MDTFYNHHIFVCQNEREPGHKRSSCGLKGASALRDYAKKKALELRLPATRVNVAGCLDRCELGPVLVIYPDETWYHFTCEADIDEILISHIQNGQKVERLLLKKDQRALAEGQIAVAEKITEQK